MDDGFEIFNSYKIPIIRVTGYTEQILEIYPYWFRKQIPANERYYDISFEDGFISVLSNAIPELEKRNIPFSICFPTAYIGGKHNMPMYANEIILNEEQILSLNKELVNIGSHTVNNLRLTQIS